MSVLPSEPFICCFGSVPTQGEPVPVSIYGKRGVHSASAVSSLGFASHAVTPGTPFLGSSMQKDGFLPGF